ncbi:MAG: transcription-repair coupling factor [bacterium]|nr:transcription-repair coupling factor [bacterium]
MNKFDNIFNIKNDKYIEVSGLNTELSCIYIYNAFLKLKKSTMVVVNNLYEATKMYEILSNYTSKVLFFPMDDFITSEALVISPELMLERVNTINHLIDDYYIVVTNLMGFLRYLPVKEIWKKSKLTLKKGDIINRDVIIDKLYKIGYSKKSMVSDTGDIAVRGFVLDIYAIGYDNPFRIEFFDDEIDSIRYFNIEDQLSISEIDNIDILPVTEFIIDKIVEEEDMKQKYLPVFSDNVNGIFNYIDSSVCFYVDYNQILNGYSFLCDEILEYKSKNKDKYNTNYMFELDKINFTKEFYLMGVDNICLKDNEIVYETYQSKSIENFHGNLSELNTKLDLYKKQGKTVILCFDNSSVSQRITNYLERNDLIFTTLDKIVDNEINIVIKKISNGYIIDNLVVISNNDLFYTKQKHRYVSKFKSGSRIKDVKNIEKGDYIVHSTNGIGIYDGIVTLVKDGCKKDYIKLLYLENDCLYIPVEKIDSISKYASKEGIVPRIDKLGSDSWKKKKEKVRNKINDIATKILEISAQREALNGFAFSKDDETQLIFENEFEFTDTKDQALAIEKIKRSMEKQRPMDMLLCGDVGYGKTEVAFRAIFKAVNDGKQVAYLCPTTILASQQYKSALKRFANYGIEIGLLNRFVAPKDQKVIISKLKEGKVDILFGTHRILSKDIVFKDLGLLVIDEEQRFGVTHKERIKEYKSNVDVLTLSATPIPRTLQMSVTGIRELALIETPPVNRYPIQTYVLPFNEKVIKDAIYKELARGGQCFVLYNRVENIEEKVDEIMKLVPDAKIDFAHGRMTKIMLEDKMMNFINNKFNVLVCTTIIETGIDIPNVNTLIIIDADRFGLSQLYQIRGRIGRSERIGYAYLMYDKHKVLNDLAVKRLNTIKEFTELGSGFRIAMRDLSIRGAGDIIGSEQSGFINTVGMELYLKMVNDAVLKLKGEKEKEVDTDNTALITVDTHIGEEYLLDDDLKIEVNKMINEIDSYEKLKEVKLKFEDRFGKINNNLEIYLYEEWFEKIARLLKIKKVKQTKDIIDIYLPKEISSKIEVNKLFNSAYDICKKFNFSYHDEEIVINLKLKGLEEHFLIYLTKLLELVKELVNS